MVNILAESPPHPPPSPPPGVGGGLIQGQIRVFVRACARDSAQIFDFMLFYPKNTLLVYLDL